MASTPFFAETDYVNPTADPTRDSFSRLRVTQPVTLFDSKQLVDNQPLLWDDQQVSGTATSTYDSSKVCSTLAVSNLTAGRRVRQTFQRFPYQPGKSHSIIMTGMMGTAAPGIVKRIGYFDDNNGIFFQASEGKMMAVVRKATVDTVVPSDNWIFDPMDGTGKSHYTLDLTKVQIFKFDFEWLGAGSVRFSFIINGQECIVHRQDCGNVLAAVYMLNPNLPLRYEIINTGTGPAASMDCICSTVASEGGFADTGSMRTADNLITGLAGVNNDSIYPILGIRLASTKQMASVKLLNFAVMSDGSATNLYRVALYLNPTLAGSAPSWSAVSNSAVEFSTPANTNTATGGTLLISDYGVGKIAIGGLPQSLLALGANIAGTSDTLFLCVQRIASGANTYYGSLTWREQV